MVKSYKQDENRKILETVGADVKWKVRCSRKCAEQVKRQGRSEVFMRREMLEQVPTAKSSRVNLRCTVPGLTTHTTCHFKSRHI
jgi:hypothetical protein